MKPLTRFDTICPLLAVKTDVLCRDQNGAGFQDSGFRSSDNKAC